MNREMKNIESLKSERRGSLHAGREEKRREASITEKKRKAEAGEREIMWREGRR